MNKVDFSHESIPNTVPQGFDFWEPHWRLEEKIVNGKTVRLIIKNEPKKAVNAVIPSPSTDTPVTTGETFFKCDKCDYTSTKKQGIVMHVMKKHKDS